MLRFTPKPTSYRTKTVPMPEDPYAVSTDPAPLVVPPENAAAHLRNCLQILRGVDPLTQGASQVNEGILAAEARVYRALAQLEGTPTAVPQADGANE